MDPNSIMIQYKKVMDYWHVSDQEHLLISEYASFAVDRGGAYMEDHDKRHRNVSNIKAVEGNALYVPWFYEAVRSIHKNFGQTVVEVEILRTSTDDGKRVRIEDQFMTLDEAVARLSRNEFLG